MSSYQTSHKLSPLPPGLSRPEQTSEQLPNLAQAFTASAGLVPAGANK
jgi:hypothetical protein